MLTHWWFALAKDGTSLSRNQPRTVGLTDLTHSAGAGLIATICACIVALLFTASVWWGGEFDWFAFLRCGLAVALAILLVGVQWLNLSRLCMLTQGFIELNTLTALAETSNPLLDIRPSNIEHTGTQDTEIVQCTNKPPTKELVLKLPKSFSKGKRWWEF